MAFEIRVAKAFAGFELETAFDSEAGVTALFGRSGCGKTSVLNMVAGVLKPDEGRIVVGGVVLFDSRTGVDLRPEKRRCGYIFQDGRLFPHLTVRQNLLYGARFSDEAGALLSLHEAVSLLGIDALLDRTPSTLSGGEAQRVCIGRALLAGPRVLLMDEPLTFLDEARREEIFTILERLRDELALPILYVSHDRAELTRLRAEVVPMEASGEKTQRTW